MWSNSRDWRIATLSRLLVAHGVNIRKLGGSHVVFEHPAVARRCRSQRTGQSSRFPSVRRVYRGGERAMSDTEYRFTVRPLTEEEGGGYLIEFPDLLHLGR
jgi:hypothetical protein